MNPLSSQFPGKRVLVAEDYEINQEVIRDILELFECEVEIAENGQIAAEMFEQGQYDLIFMDIQMPVLDGYQATQAIRAKEKEGEHITIIALTANAMSGDREKCMEAGMDDYVPKPIETTTIEAMLSKYLSEKQKA